MKFTAKTLSSLLLIAAASASGGWEYTFHVDCHMSGERATSTSNTIRATFYDASGNYIKEREANGIDCKDSGKALFEFTSFDTFDFHDGYELAPRVRSVHLQIEGRDAALIDRAWLTERNFHSLGEHIPPPVMEWGENDKVGWCLSRDRLDYENNDWRENVPDDNCFDELSFEANGKVYGTIELN